MRAARLLQILLLLQNRGRQSAAQLAEELEVAPRTILRDVDAMTEAGLPIIAYQGHGGGIELGFNYRTRLTGLARDEAVALGLMLSADNPMIVALDLEQAARRARAKLIESLPDTSREEAQESALKFILARKTMVDDKHVRAMAMAVRNSTVVRIRFATETMQVIHPTGLMLDGAGWAVKDEISGEVVPAADWGRLNVSSNRFVKGD